MQTPVEIDFQRMSARPDIHASIEQHVAALEQRYGRVTACRVVLKAPGEHHQTGGLYEVNIRLVLPNGREVDVGRTPQADERHADLSFAINDAFKHARRQLQDHVRRLQGQVSRTPTSAPILSAKTRSHSHRSDTKRSWSHGSLASSARRTHWSTLWR
jgi:ribosome-associated translation inhibitor RaiA